MIFFKEFLVQKPLVDIELWLPMATQLSDSDTKYWSKFHFHSVMYITKHIGVYNAEFTVVYIIFIRYWHVTYDTQGRFL